MYLMLRKVRALAGFSLFFCALFVLSGIILLRDVPTSHVVAQSDSQQQIYLPFIHFGPTQYRSTANEVIDDSQSGDDDWETYQNEKGGFSFRYPANWTLSELDKGSIELTPPTGERQERIWLVYQDFEIGEGDNLIEWAEVVFALPFSPGYGRSFSPITLDVVPSHGVSQQAIEEFTVPGGGYLITHGQLVLEVSTFVDTDLQAEITREIATSIVFAENAPLNQEQLSHPEPPPTFTTIEAWRQYEADIIDAGEALTVRMQTGETPTGLLAAMSERARAEYEAMLAQNAEYIAELDRQREAQASPTPPPTPDPGTNSPEFYEAERKANEQLLENGMGSEQAALIPDVTNEVVVQTAAVMNDFANRRGLPARFTTPIRVYPQTDIKCNSALHDGKDTYAIDVMVPEQTPVFATTQDETVITVGNMPNGYGLWVLTRSTQTARGTQKYYYHTYAHLFRIDVLETWVLQPANRVGLSGNTGNSSDPHLHYQTHTHPGLEDNSGPPNTYVPVDLSPVKGFVPTLGYPTAADCGDIQDPSTTPIIIEANEYHYWSQPVGSGHYWNCSTYLPNHTGTCYRAVIPITPEWGLAPINYSNVHLTPRISYNVWIPVAGNYRVWVCGMGGNVNDDSLHMGQNSSLLGTADNMDHYHSSNWVWRSHRMDNSNPYLYLQYGYNNIDMYARENGMRVDRILLTTNSSYNPTNAGIRCGGQGLF